jgi:hypothetical protein
MKKSLTIIIFFIITLIAFGQKQIGKETSAIVAEGKLLYKSEMASWYGTDIFLDKYKDKADDVGGYFSYLENNIAKCIFFSNDDNPKVIATITFDSTYNVNIAQIDGNEREFTTYENDLYTIRKKTLKEVNSDTLIKMYKNTNINLVPLINNNEKKVYILTVPENNGIVIFGNDYLFTFDKNNNLVSKKQIHKNIIVNEYSKGQESEIELKEALHTHLASTGKFITSTNICTLMLYENFAKWEKYYVISDEYVSIWNCKTNKLTVITREVWDKMNKDQKERHLEK